MDIHRFGQTGVRYGQLIERPDEHARRLQSRLKAVQTVLGDHQYTAVARPVLRELGAAAPAEAGSGFTFGLMYGMEQARAERLQRQLPTLWRRMREATGWLAK